MMYPKPQRKKKRKKHKASILHCKDGTCYLCMKLKGDYRRYPVVHEHHIYDGPNRQNSEAEGLKVYLCLDHHIMGPEAVHNNHKNMRILHRDGQRAYERTHSRAEFMSLIGRNYLNEEKQEEPENLTVVIVKKGDSLAGLVVDNLIGQQEIVIKSLGKHITYNKLFSGATILGDGEVALILDTNTLF